MGSNTHGSTQRVIVTRFGRWIRRWWGGCLLCACLAPAAEAEPAAESGPGAASTLQARYLVLQPQLENSPFRRSLHLVSTESPLQLQGEVYVVMNYPMSVISQAFTDPAHWCDVLILHINTKYCRAAIRPAGSQLAVRIGKKDFQPLAQAALVEFDYRVGSNSDEYFDVGLYAENGPMSTSNYRIRLEAVALQEGKTFLHITYAYAYNRRGQLAMQMYLATLGRDKVGFTLVTPAAGGPPQPIRGVRGVVERNTMRYYLAMEAYLGGLSAPPAQRVERRLQSWHSATEMYARQLHEVDLNTYLDMKRRELVRQQTQP